MASTSALTSTPPFHPATEPSHNVEVKFNKEAQRVYDSLNAAWENQEDFTRIIEFEERNGNFPFQYAIFNNFHPTYQMKLHTPEIGFHLVLSQVLSCDCRQEEGERPPTLIKEQQTAALLWYAHVNSQEAKQIFNSFEPDHRLLLGGESLLEGIDKIEELSQLSSPTHTPNEMHSLPANVDSDTSPAFASLSTVEVGRPMLVIPKLSDEAKSYLPILLDSLMFRKTPENKHEPKVSVVPPKYQKKEAFLGLVNSINRMTTSSSTYHDLTNIVEKVIEHLPKVSDFDVHQGKKAVFAYFQELSRTLKAVK
ncbi:hypothetical protein D5018_11420 [Parashewanella curva]|uniref:Uncharacterized protein n=1 Tax=Parashewanella curva TaxID=2338552 RepID=A0A3L8PVU5_9GAMM|nr:hypothetical protein [Parashewanella curva]RLV59557.1 hypothetical protein D5018_11420 [Parashewanella curva]